MSEEFINYDGKPLMTGEEGMTLQSVGMEMAKLSREWSQVILQNHPEILKTDPLVLPLFLKTLALDAQLSVIADKIRIRNPEAVEEIVREYKEKDQE